MKPLPHPDNKHLEAAEGWLGLGDHLSASEELEHISPAFMAHRRVLGVRLQISSMAKNWEACIDLASTLLTLAPDNEWAWIKRSYALHELKRTQEAHDLLLPIEPKSPKNWVIPYNLACYAARLNRLEEAEKCKRHAEHHYSLRS
jgi:tetratricopeptide (TPR) repeat protein